MLIKIAMIEYILDLKVNNWWSWHKKEGEVCPVPS
jgi:hypothetical protein